MRKDWRDCAPTSRGHGRRAPKYDVLVTVVKNKNATTPVAAEWERMGVSFTFKNKGYDRIVDHNAAYLRISMIQPNSSRIYFDFMPDTFESKALGRRLSSKNGNEYKTYRTIFPLLSKREHELIVGHWIGEYELHYDADCSNYYIENKAVRGWLR